jgi:phenylacetate-coenzyme A ligase PaaK-like adenylate-forming protein
MARERSRQWIGTAQVRRRIHEVVGITVEVAVVPPKTIERSAGKARRVQNLRANGGSRA